MTHLQIWLQNHNRRLTQAAIDEALMEYITHIESKLADLQAENELLKQVEANLAELHNVTLAEYETLRSRLAEIEAQEPVAHMNAKRDMTFIHGPYNPDDIPLFAAPVVSPDVAALKDELEAARKDAERYVKLRRWMTSNVSEGWEEVCKLASLGCWVGWDEFDCYLDALPKCNVGLCYDFKDAAIEQAKGGV